VSIRIDPDTPSASGGPGSRALVAVAAGGAMGTIARYGISRAGPTSPGSIPWSIFFVNVAGSLALGFLLQLVLEHWPTNRFIRPFVAVGFIGAFTTFSTVMVDVDLLVRDGAVGNAAVYIVVSVIAGLTAVFVGIAIARLFAHQQHRHGETSSC
jgi:fluoride exporter